MPALSLALRPLGLFSRQALSSPTQLGTMLGLRPGSVVGNTIHATLQRWGPAVHSRHTVATAAAAAGASPGGRSAGHAAQIKQTLEGKVVSAGELLTQEYLMSVPFAQRPYLWGREQAEQLLEDLVATAGTDSDGPVSSRKEFPLGSLVLAETPPGAGILYTRKHVFDGQQRIVTLCLLLAALRERLEAAGQGEPDEGLDDDTKRTCSLLAVQLMDKVHQEADHFQEWPPLPRITLRQQKDTDFLVQLLTDSQFLARTDIKPGSNTQARLLSNIQLFRAELRKMPALQCKRLASFATTKITFIITVSSDFSLALTIFRSSMAKGVDMRPIDLLKAHVFEAIPVADQERWGAEWERLEAELSPTTADGKPAGDDLLSELCGDLTPILLGRFGVTNSEFTDLPEAYHTAAEQLGPAGTAGVPFIQRVLQPFAQAYRELRSARIERGAAPQRASYQLRSLTRFLEGGKTYTAELRPIVLLLLVLNAEQRLPDDRLIAALKQVEVLALASTLCKWSKKARRERSLAVLRGLGYAGATPQPLAQGQHDPVELPAELQLSAEEKCATLEALDGPLYAKTAGISKPILLRLNEFVLQSSGRDYVHYEEGSTVLTVEHVLPQKPSAPWMEAFTPEEHAAWVSRGANLALLAGEKNSSAGNKDFAAKKQAYQSKHVIGTCGIPLTDDILKCDRWSPAELERRQRDLLNWAAACWSLH